MRLDTYRAINPLCSQITDFPCIPRATRHSQSRVKLLQVVILHLLCPSTCQQFSPQPKSHNLFPDSRTTHRDSQDVQLSFVIADAHYEKSSTKCHLLHCQHWGTVKFIEDAEFQRSKRWAGSSWPGWSQLVWAALSRISPSTGSAPVTANSVNWGKWDCTDDKCSLRQCPVSPGSKASVSAHSLLENILSQNITKTFCSRLVLHTTVATTTV